MSFIFGYKVLSNRKVRFLENTFDKVIETLEYDKEIGSYENRLNKELSRYEI